VCGEGKRGGGGGGGGGRCILRNSRAIVLHQSRLCRWVGH